MKTISWLDKLYIWFHHLPYLLLKFCSNIPIRINSGMHVCINNNMRPHPLYVEVGQITFVTSLDTIISFRISISDLKRIVQASPCIYYMYQYKTITSRLIDIAIPLWNFLQRHARNGSLHTKSSVHQVEGIACAHTRTAVNTSRHKFNGSSYCVKLEYTFQAWLTGWAFFVWYWSNWSRRIVFSDCDDVMRKYYQIIGKFSWSCHHVF